MHGRARGGIQYNGQNRVESYCILLDKSSNIRMDAPGKGNIFNGFDDCISQTEGQISNVTIQNNKIGLAEDGTTYESIGKSNINNIKLNNTDNLRIGEIPLIKEIL